MTEIYIHFLFDNYGLSGNAPVLTCGRCKPVAAGGHRVVDGPFSVFGGAGDVDHEDLPRNHRVLRLFWDYHTP